MAIVWVVTGVNPHPRGGRHHTHGADDGRVGWRLHAVNAENGEATTFKELRAKSAAVCGLFPAHGWELDLFVDEPCARCIRVVEKRGDQEALAALDQHQRAGLR